MAANDPQHRHLSARIAAIVSRNGDHDPRLPALRDQLNRLAISEIHEWAHRAARALPPLTAEEIRAAAAVVRQVDRRITRQAQNGATAAATAGGGTDTTRTAFGIQGPTPVNRGFTAGAGDG
jgi:hypothetical protein